MIVAELTYSVEPFVEGRYFVMPQFATKRRKTTTSGDLPDEAFPALEQASGSIRVSFPAAPLWKDKTIVRPFALHFVLNEWAGRPRSHILARTTPLPFVAK